MIILIISLFKTQAERSSNSLDYKNKNKEKMKKYKDYHKVIKFKLSKSN